VRLVLDTNAAVSSLLWQGNPGKLLDAAQAGSLTLYASAPLLAELHGVLGREKFAKHLQVRGLSATQIFEGYAALTTVVVPAIIPPAVIDDPDDDAVLACAVAAKADLVVSIKSIVFRAQEARHGNRCERHRVDPFRTLGRRFGRRGSANDEYGP